MNDVQFHTKMGLGAYSARGNGGQFIVVAPARGIVVVHLNDQSGTTSSNGASLTR